VPKRLDEFSAEEVENFPKLWDYPEEYVVKWAVVFLLAIKIEYVL
jgi:hypothetical protein